MANRSRKSIPFQWNVLRKITMMTHCIIFNPLPQSNSCYIKCLYASCLKLFFWFVNVSAFINFIVPTKHFFWNKQNFLFKYSFHLIARSFNRYLLSILFRMFMYGNHRYLMPNLWWIPIKKKSGINLSTY